MPNHASALFIAELAPIVLGQHLNCPLSLIDNIF